MTSKEKIKAWKETTSTSPSGRHLGRYKALFAPSTYDIDEDTYFRDEFRRKQQSIAAYTLSIVNYCIRHGHVLDRWKTIANVMIFKDPGNFKIHRLRVIHIYEADFNLLLAVKWRQLMKAADESGHLHDGQFGGRPGYEAQFLTLLEELKYDIAYASRRSLFQFDNDAMSCYDRIILALASIISRKYGQHRQVVLVHAKTLEEARYRLRMALNLSATEYSHCMQFPLYGSGQGSGNSPCIWMCISSTLFEVHSTQAHGATFVSPDGTRSIRITMVGFVDDTTGSCNDFRPQTQMPIRELAKRMEADAQTWQDLVHVSGGGLELTKSSFQALYFKFEPSGKPRVVLDAVSDCIHIRDSKTGLILPINAMRANETRKTLGHYKGPADSKQRRQLADISKKAKTLSVRIAISPVSRYGTTLSYYSMFLPTVKYPLSQSFFTQAALNSAESRVLGSIITKCGYNQHTAYALLYAPTSLAGGGFVHWYTLQGEGQTQTP
jgi:hypothetical protein